MAGRRRTSGFAAALLALLATDAAAGDVASVQPLGFSADGRIFAFEEYGIQDGSGHAYATITIIDMVANRFLPGAPVRVVIEEDGNHIARARRDAHRRAEPLIFAHGLADNPGLLAAFNPETETESPAGTLSYASSTVEPNLRRTFTLVLEEKAFPADGICKNFLTDLKGFRLVMTRTAGRPTEDVLQDDLHVPRSRRCATGYRIGGVVTHQNADGSEVHAVLVLVKSLGFEGSGDGRWIVVPAAVAR